MQSVDVDVTFATLLVIYSGNDRTLEWKYFCKSHLCLCCREKKVRSNFFGSTSINALLLSVCSFYIDVIFLNFLVLSTFMKIEVLSNWCCYATQHNKSNVKLIGWFINDVTLFRICWILFWFDLQSEYLSLREKRSSVLLINFVGHFEVEYLTIKTFFKRIS